MPRPLARILVLVPALLVLATVVVWAVHALGPREPPAGGPPPAQVEEKTVTVAGVTFVVEYRPGTSAVASRLTADGAVFERDDAILEYADGSPLLRDGVGYPSLKPGDTARWAVDGTLHINGDPAGPHPVQSWRIDHPGNAAQFGVDLKGNEPRDSLTLSWSRDGRYIGTGTKGDFAGGRGCVWDRDSPFAKWIVWHRPPSLAAAEAGFLTALSPDGNTLVTGYRGGAVAVPWDVATQRADWPHTGPPGGLWGLQFLTDRWLLEVRGTPGAERLVARDLGGDRTATADLGRVAVPFAPAFSVSGDGATLAVSDGAAVRVARLTPGADGLRAEPVATLDLPGVTHLALTKDGKELAAAAPKPRLALYQVAAGSTARRLRVRDGGEGGARRPTAIQALAFAPDSNTLAVGTDDSLRLYDVPSGRERGWLPLDGVRAVGYSSDGQYLAATLRADPETPMRVWTTAWLRSR